MKNSVVIVAAGMGRRMNASTSKQLIHIGGKPILWHTLDAFERMPFIHEIILVVKEDEQAYIESEMIKGMAKVSGVVVGGKERSDSVKNGLDAVRVGEVVMIHDGARPFIKEEAVKKLVDALETVDAAILAVPVKDTIKEVDSNGRVNSTFDRSKLWAVQTPQAFKRAIIEEAFAKADEVTSIIYDDAMLVEAVSDRAVTVVEGDYSNIKVTTPFDLIVGNAIYEMRVRENDIG